MMCVYDSKAQKSDFQVFELCGFLDRQIRKSDLEPLKTQFHRSQI